jgi:hypothetical protein
MRSQMSRAQMENLSSPRVLTIMLAEEY